jgi:hypothetical protein
MRIKLSYLTPLLAAGAIAAAIAGAPIAAADQSCSGNVCQSPGNVQINDSPPPVQSDPYGGYGPALGVFGGGGQGR